MAENLFSFLQKNVRNKKQTLNKNKCNITKLTESVDKLFKKTDKTCMNLVLMIVAAK